MIVVSSIIMTTIRWTFHKKLIFFVEWRFWIFITRKNIGVQEKYERKASFIEKHNQRIISRSWQSREMKNCEKRKHRRAIWLIKKIDFSRFAFVSSKLFICSFVFCKFFFSWFLSSCHFCCTHPLFILLMIVSIQLLRTYLFYFFQSMSVIHERLKKQTVIEILSVVWWLRFLTAFLSIETLCAFFSVLYFSYSFHVITYRLKIKERSYREKLYSIFHKHQQFIIFLVFLEFKCFILHISRGWWAEREKHKHWCFHRKILFLV